MYISGTDTQHTPLVWKQGPNTLQLGLGSVSGSWNAIAIRARTRLDPDVSVCPTCVTSCRVTRGPALIQDL